MRAIGLSLILLSGGSGAAFAASQFGPIFAEAKAGKPIDDAMLRIDFAKVDLAEETPVLLDVLNGTDPKLARRAAAAVDAVLVFRQDVKTKIDALALAPSLIAHYDDPDAEQPGTVVEPTDFWRQRIMNFLLLSDAVPPPALIEKMLADLDRKGDAFGATAGMAAMALSHLRPLPQRVLDELLAKMDESPRSRVQVIEALGASRVDSPEVIRRISLALLSQVGADPVLANSPLAETSAQQNTNEVRRVAARALGLIGPAAKDALTSLRTLVDSADSAIDRDTREAARQAIKLIDARR